MANKRNRVLRYLTECRLRIKQRDYTIPVRLNQPLLSTNVNLLLNNDVAQINPQQTKMTNKISIKAKRFKPSTLMVIAIATLTISTKAICHTQTSSLKSQVQKNRHTDNGPNKEHLLSYLAENIERQHLMKPVRAFVQQRPSKFDSGDDLSYESSEVNYVHRNSTPTHQKVDEGLRQILRMHEKANQNRPVESSTSSSSADIARSSRWREFSKNPARVAANLINPNKVVSQVMSYISPLISSKLISPSIFDLKGILNSNNNGSKLGLNPFTSRSNNQVTPTKSIFNMKKIREASHNYATTLPQASYLAKPESFEKSNGRQFSTQPTNFLDDIGDTVLKSSLIKPNLSPKDLLASESSSSSNQIATPQPELAESANQLNENYSKGLRSQSASSWFKNNANKLAQNYLQDSLRSLLTLSQLPILQANHISTAPSVLEKPYKKKAVNKVGSQPAPQSQSQSQRALAELYRYAYILGTRRKRDPLAALSSSTSLIKQKGVFSQRSRNQLLAAPNNNQLMNYARSIRTALGTGAKPRGVMWDMATDPSLAVTVFHLLERASVALPLGGYIFYLIHL